MQQLSIVVLNYCTSSLVNACVGSLLPEIDGIDASIVLVDNNSPDESSSVIQDWLIENDVHKKVMFVQSEHNGGFASGNNLGIKSLQADYYLLLNSDTVVRPGSIKELLNTAENHDAGIYSPRLEWPDGTGQESCFRFHSPCSEFLSAAQTGVFDKIFNRSVVALPVQTAIARPEWTSFACVLIKDEVFENIGLLDESYFMYFEDVEFCHRAAQAGWGIIHNPEARVVHLRGGSSSVKENTRLNKRVPRYYYESRARFFYQVYGWTGLIEANCLWWTGRLISKTRQLLGRKDKAAVEKQWLDTWINCLSPTKAYTHPASKIRD